MKVLHIDSSIQGSASATRDLTQEIVTRLTAARPDARVTYRDLAAQELPHFSHAALTRSDELEAARNAAVLEEFLAADTLVIGAPLYNFSIPSQLKAWIDRIVRAGRTFRYEPSGPVGLAGGKRVVIVSSRGGAYASAERAHLDFQESYLKLILGFMGVTDVRIIRAEGLAMGPEHRERATRAARAAIAELFELAA